MSKGLGKGLVVAIVVAMVLGAIVGPLIRSLSESIFATLDEYLFELLGDLFLRAISMVVIPVIFVSLALGIANVGDPGRLGRMGAKTVALYIATTMIAIAVGLSLGNLFQPGVGIERTVNGNGVPTKETIDFTETIRSVVPENPLAAMAEGNVLATIVMALLVGVILSRKQEEFQSMITLLREGQRLIMQAIALIMWMAPVGVFALMASALGNAGVDVVAGMATYSVLVIAGLLIQMFVVYVLLLVVGAKLPPNTFYQKLVRPLMIGFSTSSSSATLPVTLETVQEELGVDEDVASLVIPLGTTLNMDGTALVQGLATVFIAQAYGIDLSLGQQLTVVGMATAASIGTAGVPGVGIVMLAMILRSVDLPVEGIGLVLGVDRILDMVRTAKNVAGDAVVSLVVAHSEGKLNRDTFHS